MRTSTPSTWTCRCGHGIDSLLVDAKPRYGFWSMFWLINGATGFPKSVTWTCRRCGEDLGTSRDPDVLKTFR